MALSGANFSTTLQGLFALRGYVGISMPDFTDAVGVGGIDNHAIGQTFATIDAGGDPGAGAGTGTGITGLVPATIAAQIFADSVSAFGQAGIDLLDVSADLGTAFVAEMANATLSSVHAIKGGSGTVVVGSISFDPTAMGAAITLEGTSNGFAGMNWPDFADVIGGAFADNVVASGTGTVAIAPGAGAGNVIS